MKTLPIKRDEKGNRATVECATGEVSVYSYCGYCVHCRGIRRGARVYPPPQEKAMQNISRGIAADDSLMNAAMQFNMLIRDGTAVECDDDDNRGFKSRYQR